MSMKDVLGLILGGGVGKRLYPLTAERAKPAVPLAGKYRLIDIPMSNCFHADIEKIAILTQFNSASLHRHIWNTYTRDVFTSGWVQILAAEQTPLSRDWYQGTADAVRKQIIEIRQAGTKYILILAGDHLYRMDYRDFVDFHIANKADISIAVHPVSPELVPGLGILKLDDNNRITDFVEKPRTEEARAGFESSYDPEKPYMASMGIYVFNADFLYALLDEEGDDFGHDLIPSAINSGRDVFGYVFDGYWEDIGTIRRFYEVNLQMAAPDPPFDFYDAERPIYTHARFLPGSEIQNARLHNVLLADGCRIDSATVNEAVVGLRSIIGQEAKIKETIVMGGDYYETDAEKEENKRLGQPNIGIGAHTVISGAIIDKNARIGDEVTIRYRPDREDFDNGNWVAVDGIIVVPKNAIIPDGTVI
jgi:glucose-1-phosphate adenylyltransferase